VKKRTTPLMFTTQTLRCSIDSYTGNAINKLY
jgi:hypothetical protein